MTPDERSCPPEPSELELSVFGPGVGECVCVHLGDGAWMVVDSCIDSTTRNPVALDYFAALGLSPATAIRSVVVTHWHDDHTQGADQVLAAAPEAELVCSAALRVKELKTALEASGEQFMEPSGIGALRRTFEVALDRKTRRTGKAPRFVVADTTIWRSGGATVHALSPAPAVQWNAFRELGQLIPSPKVPRRRAVAHTQNDVAVALWVELGEVRALLGADLERGTAAPSGWQAVVQSTTRPTGRAKVFKVPHHGSDGADEPAVWTHMLDSDPVAVLTPYRAGSKPLPTEAALNELGQRTGDLYCSAPNRGKRPRMPGSMRRLVDRVAREVRELRGPMGQVRVRVNSQTGAVSVQVFGKAFRVVSAA